MSNNRAMSEQEMGRLPIIKLWERILVPLQGEITDDLADRLRRDVLGAIHVSGAKGLVIDVTAVWMVDSHLCAVLSALASSAKLMGTATVICGMSPEIALTLQTMGIELKGVESALTVEEAFAALGLRVETPRKKTLARKPSAPNDQAPEAEDGSFLRESGTPPSESDQ